MNKPKTTQSFIKWTGSKRHIANQIVGKFPQLIDKYYEPFIGGGSVFFELLRSGKSVNQYLLSDANESLINIYKLLFSNPQILIESYLEKWSSLQKDSNFFYSQREIFNESGCPLAFYFLTRTCYNGTIRFSKNGKFNTSHHFGRKGMAPEKVKKSILYHHDLMAGKDISFSTSSFESVLPKNCEDVMYLDPPYTNTKTLYFGNIDFNKFQEWLNSLPCSWFLNINGINSKDNEEIISAQYNEKILLDSGNSSFSRMKGKNVNVQEYFYIKHNE